MEKIVKEGVEFVIKGSMIKNINSCLVVVGKERRLRILVILTIVLEDILVFIVVGLKQLDCI